MKHPETVAAVLKIVATAGYSPQKPRQLARQLGIKDREQVAEFKKIIKRMVRDGQLRYASNHYLLPGDLSSGEAPAQKIRNRPLAAAPRNGAAVAGRQANSAGETRAAQESDADEDATDHESDSKIDDSEIEDGGSDGESDGAAQREAPTARPKRRSEKSHPPGSLVGVFRRAQGGFGFVRPHGIVGGADRTQDIYIDGANAHDAASGDTVLVRVSKRPHSFRPNREGEIIEILERDTHRFVGTYFESGGVACVQVDGTLFAQPVLVGDPGAKNAQPDDKVVVEMVRFPSHVRQGEGVIVDVLGKRGEPGVDLLSIIHEYGLPGDFAEDVAESARQQAEKFDENDLTGRTDRTAETIITIDPVDTRDFDDAISLKRLENGHWLLGVHIADVTHFVPPKTPLDREAHERATSVYLPDKVIPMLPEVISNNLASLQPDRVRFALTCNIEFTADGAFVGADAESAAILSKRRFTYEEVDEYLADRDAWRDKLTPQVHDLLGRMHELAMTLRRRRIRRGALELTMKEVKVDLDKRGQVVGAHVVENTESHQIIEEFMLAANEAIADMLFRRELLFLRRVHAAPDPRKLKILTDFVTGLGIQCDSLENRFELQRVLDAVKDHPEQHAVNYATLRSLQRAIYSPEEEGHFALASDCYCHFTSPIRRYPDLTVHRLIKQMLAGKKIKNDFDALAVLGEHCSDREQRAEAAERELTKLKLLLHMQEKIGQEMDAVVTGVEEFGLFVQGTQIPAEGLVHVTTLADDFYRYDRASHTLTGHRSGNQFRLGDHVRVVVARVDVDKRELDFRLASVEPQQRRSRQTPYARKGQRPGKNERAAIKETGRKGDSLARGSRTSHGKKKFKPGGKGRRGRS